MDTLQRGRGKLLEVMGMLMITAGGNCMRVYMSKLCTLNVDSLSQVKHTSVKLLKNV